MGDIQVGDELFGSPVIDISNNKITIMPAPGTPISFDADQFNAQVLRALEIAGQFIPHR